MTKLISKSELIQKIAEQHANKMTRKDVKAGARVARLDWLQGAQKIRRFPGARICQICCDQEAGTKARPGINPFTKEPTMFKAKPARKIVRVRPVKAAKDAVA